MKKKIIVGNWKMNPTTLDEAKRIYRSIKNASLKLNNITIVICPPFVYLNNFLNKKRKSTILIGAQNIFFEEQGAFTGEISPIMLKDLGVSFVIVGHSERRAEGETDEMIAKKVNLLLEFGIHPILCIGEKERDDNGIYLDFIKNQIKNSLNKVSKKYINKLIIAYEPIWAIGAKKAMNPPDIRETTIFVKKVLSDIYGHDEGIKTPILYGGTVNFRDASDIINIGEVDGLLVGRESVNSTGFNELLKTVDALI